MSTKTQPERPKENTMQEAKAIVLERLKTLDVDRKHGSSMEEVFLRITNKKPKP